MLSDYDVFISHVEEDKSIAVALAQRLEDAGIKCWYYERDNIPGPGYMVQIMERIETSKICLLMISRDSLSSDQVDAEVKAAYEEHKPFIPILIGISHVEFQTRKRDWKLALRDSSSICMEPSDAAAILQIAPRVIDGVKAILKRMGIGVQNSESTGLHNDFHAIESAQCDVTHQEKTLAINDDVLRQLEVIIENNRIPSSELLKHCTELAEKGNSCAQQLLGDYYFYGGYGIEQDKTNAVKWYREAAEQGEPNAQCKLGLCYAIGEGVEQNLEIARQWCKKAVLQGHETAKKLLQNDFNTTSVHENSSSAQATSQLRVLFNKIWVLIDLTDIRIFLDEIPIGTGSLSKGIDITVEAKAGSHVLCLRYHTGILRRNIKYTIELLPFTMCEAHLTYSWFMGVFTNDIDLRFIPIEEYRNPSVKVLH